MVTTGSSLERPVLELRGVSPVSQKAVARGHEVDRGDVEQEPEARRRCRPAHGRPRGPSPTAPRVVTSLRCIAAPRSGRAPPSRALPRSSSRCCWSRAPVHSSMKTFLNSIASAHPRPAKCRCTQRLSSPPRKRTFSRTSKRRPRTLRRPSSSMKRSTTWPQRSRSSEPVPTFTSGFSAARRRRRVDAVAAVVVGVHVEHEERSAARRARPAVASSSA